MICLTYHEAYNEKTRIEKCGGEAIMTKRWYGWSVTKRIFHSVTKV